ncbi:DinB family protein [Magnetospira thiophila]
MRDYFLTLARYNAWANARLCNACSDLPRAEISKPRQSFFGSIQATLNHLLVGETLWLARLQQTEPGVSRLDEVLYEEFVDLRQARENMDRQLIAFVENLSTETLEEDLHYRDTTGREMQTPMRFVLAHLFNHGTHHRGQIHDMLTQVPSVPPPLDLIYFLRETG